MNGKFKKAFLFCSMPIYLFAAILGVSLTSSKNAFKVVGGNITYTTSFNSSTNKLTSGSGTKEATTDEGNKINFIFSGVSNYASGWQILDNTASYFANSDPIHGLSQIELTLDTEMVGLRVYYSKTTDFTGASYIQWYSLMAGTKFIDNFNGKAPNYFKIVPEDPGLQISSLKLTYSCAG